MKTFLSSTLGAALILAPAWASALELYQTDFSDFPVGADQLTGNQGWTSSHLEQGLHGIDQDIYSGRGHSAFLGGVAPGGGADTVSVYRPFDKAVGVGSSFKMLEFQVLFGIASSFEGGEDAFGFTFFDEAGQTLAALEFNTDFLDFGVWADDGIEQKLTGADYLKDYLHLLTVSVDLETNLWNADLDGVPIFHDEIFSGVTDSPAIAGIAAEWHLAEPLDPGDNWLLFDDWSVSVTLDPSALPAPELTSIEKMPQGGIEVAWLGRPGWRYAVHTSPDGLRWTEAGAVDLPPGSPWGIFEDREAMDRLRFYRVHAVGEVQP